jgi:hypothetical protein
LRKDGRDQRLFDAISGRDTCSLVSDRKEDRLNCQYTQNRKSVHMTKQDAINKLQYLQRNDEGSNVHAEADTVLCDFLDAVGYGEIAREFRKIHEMYPTVAPRYSKPSWRL